MVKFPHSGPPYKIKFIFSIFFSFRSRRYYFYLIAMILITRVENRIEIRDTVEEERWPVRFGAC